MTRVANINVYLWLTQFDMVTDDTTNDASTMIKIYNNKEKAKKIINDV